MIYPGISSVCRFIRGSRELIRDRIAISTVRFVRCSAGQCVAALARVICIPTAATLTMAVMVTGLECSKVSQITSVLTNVLPQRFPQSGSRSEASSSGTNNILYSCPYQIFDQIIGSFLILKEMLTFL